MTDALYQERIVALAKARPGELNYGSAGAGTAIHMATELFKWMAKVDLTHIAYKGSIGAYKYLACGFVEFQGLGYVTQIPRCYFCGFGLCHSWSQLDRVFIQTFGKNHGRSWPALWPRPYVPAHPSEKHRRALRAGPVV